MKKIILIVFILPFALCLKANAQESSIINYELLQKYIDAAKQNNFQKKLADKRVEGAKTAVPIAALSYLDMVGVSYIFRPDNNTAIVAPGTGANPYLVNGLQFSVSTSLGSFVSRPFQIKNAKVSLDVAKLEAQQFGSTLETDVKLRYYAYVEAVGLLKLTAQNLQDVTIIAQSMKTKFENGTATLDVYDQSRTALTAAKNSQLTSEMNVLRAKDALELVIGKKLSDIK